MVPGSDLAQCQLKLLPPARTLSAMRNRFGPMRSIPVWLRWVLSMILVLNGALAPIGMTPAAGLASATKNMPASTVSHCHHDNAAKAIDSTHFPRNGWACCEGGKCQCGCVSPLVLPITFPDLRPLVPQGFFADSAVPEISLAPSSLLLRPPIG